MEDTKGRILTAAAQLFEQQGYRSVSMRAIAAQLGISVGNLTYHFPHKQDIATALAEQELKTIILPEEATLAALDGYLRRMLISLVDHARMFDDPLLFEDLPGQQPASIGCSRTWNGFSRSCGSRGSSGQSWTVRRCRM